MLLYQVFLIVFLILPFNTWCYDDKYRIPEPEIEVFAPKGFRVSIEDVPGIHSFALHGSINTDLREPETEDFFGQVNHKQNGKWIFEDDNAILHIGDVIHYSLFVIKERLGYRLDNGRYIVKEVINRQSKTSRSYHKLQPADVVQLQEAPENYNIDEQKPTMLTTSTPETDKDLHLQTCEQTVLNATRSLLSMQSQVDTLKRRNEQLTILLEKYPDSKMLTLSGKLPYNNEVGVTAVRFIVRENLGLNPDIISAVRNNYYSITFEVATLSEKLEILELAQQKLKNGKIALF